MLSVWLALFVGAVFSAAAPAGHRPVFAFGNSAGDRQMLEWTASGGGPRFEGMVHHTDAMREFAYDRTSKVGRLDKALDEANIRGWTVVDMKRDWRVIYSRVSFAASTNP